MSTGRVADLSRPRPKCPVLAVGDEVLVISPSGRPGREPIVAEVVEARRVWLVVQAKREGSLIGQSWRMRRDCQTERNLEYTQFNHEFVTREQYEYDQALKAADKVIWDAGIRIERSWGMAGPEWTPARRAALADLIRSLGIGGSQS